MKRAAKGKIGATRARTRSPARGGTKAARATQERRAAVARANGKLGGRPRDRLPQATLDRLGEPPQNDPLRLAAWTSQLLAEVAWLVARGEVHKELAASLRATCGAIDRAVPAATLAEIDRLMRADADAIASDDLGPQPEVLEVNGARPRA